jgi:hypothetical protein
MMQIRDNYSKKFTRENAMSTPKTYMGIDKDPKGAMNPTGNVIRDAWVFGLIPETQTCEGWSVGQVDVLYDQVSKAWEPYANLPSRLPPELAEKHQRIYQAAVDQARDKGWDPDQAVANEE